MNYLRSLLLLVTPLLPVKRRNQKFNNLVSSDSELVMNLQNFTSLSLSVIIAWCDLCITEENAETEEGSITENKDVPENENDVWKQLKDLAGYILLSCKFNTCISKFELHLRLIQLSECVETLFKLDKNIMMLSEIQ